jgi:hypothetical protein
MGSIYANSYLTVSADNAAADTEGFLKPRHVDYASVDIVPVNGNRVRLAFEKEPDFQKSREPTSK